ncbi:MAG TPA: NIPSNAP family protein, partial [Stellaceae bacterium]|nr:NIPSNAP family protein [Stellaceae bacterium]
NHPPPFPPEDAMIYEVRTYTLRPGTLAEFEERYEKRLPSRLKHSPLGAFWHTEFGPLNQAIHVYPYDDLNHRSRVRAAMANDAQRNAMPGGQDLIVEQQAEIVIPAPFMRPLGSRDYGSGNVYEMRTYTYEPGALPKVLDAWAKAVPAREELSPLAACWTSELGNLNRFTHIWVYKDANERSRIRDASRAPGRAWPPQAGVRPVRQENKLLVAAKFSPVR